jgi:hypothetical protein
MMSKQQSWSWRKVSGIELWLGKCGGPLEAEIVSTPLMDKFWWTIYSDGTDAPTDMPIYSGEAGTLKDAKAQAEDAAQPAPASEPAKEQ